MRVLEAHLEAALNAGAEPYIQLQYCMDDTFTWLDAPYPLYSYKLGDLELDVTTAGTVYYEPYAIRLKRGAYWHNVAHFVTSSAYYVNKVITTQKQQVEIQSSIISTFAWRKYSVDGHQTYRQIIDDICTLFGYTTAYEDPTAALWDNIFYPAGRTLTLQNPHAIFNLIRQKLFIYGSDNNDNEIYFRQWLDDGNVGVAPNTALETIVTFDWEEYKNRQYRRIFWRDENYTIHSYLDPVTYADLPIYNMGYLESTASTPAILVTWNRNRDKRTFHLKYQDGDIIQCSSGTYQIQPFEIFNRKESPSLYTQFVALPKFTSTEGGQLPGTIEAAAPYTPLNVSEFNKNLNSTHNNLQAFANGVDEMTCGPAIYASSEKVTPDDADIFPLVDNTTATHLVRWISWVNLQTKLLNRGWLAVPATCSWSSSDAPTYVVSFNADVNGDIGVGMRFKCTHAGSVKYFIVTDVGAYSGGAVLVTLYGGTDYTLSNSAITFPYYSPVKAPFGFPLSPDKWTVLVTDTTLRTQTTPTAATWYNPGAVSVSIPLGLWRVYYKALSYILVNGDLSTPGTCPIYITLSTANNSQSDVEFTTKFFISAVNRLNSLLSTEKILSLVSKTTYYMNVMTDTASINVIGMRNDQVTLIVRLLCAYL